jgi:hypothetical protein
MSEPLYFDDQATQMLKDLTYYAETIANSLEKRKVRVNNQFGTFHAWSIESEHVEGGSLHYPVGVVELEDGSVETYVAKQIEFVKE